MPEESEIISILREIRDLHRAHFEESKQLRAATLQRQEDAVKRSQQAAASAEQTRQANREFHRQVSRDRIVTYLSAALNAVLVFALLYAVLVLRR